MIILPSKSIPVLDECDVLVCGGGAAGCAAAIAAARHGADTIIVDKLGYLGGATVSQQVAHVLSTNGVDFQGIWHEWMHALKRRNGVAECGLIYAPSRSFIRKIRCGVDPEVVKYTWDDMMEEAGVRQLLHVWCSKAIVEDGVCKGVIVEVKEGRRAILAKRVIDCTANGDVCASAGVGWEQGDGENPWNQALTKAFRMGNVAWPEEGYSRAYLEELYAKARETVAKGEFTSPLVENGRAARYAANDAVHKSVMGYRNEMNVFPSRILRVDTTDPDDLTRAEREGRAAAWECADFIRKYIKGFEQSYLLDTSEAVGIRDSRRIHGRATATDDDAVRLRHYTDGIARSSWEIDLWPGTSYSAPAVDQTSDSGKKRQEKLWRGEWFDIRYGCIIAKGVENLFVAGRCISAERKAQGSLRIQQTCQSTGQAAGTAAALSLAADCVPEELDIEHLLRVLEKDRDVEPAFEELNRIYLGVVDNEPIH